MLTYDQRSIEAQVNEMSFEKSEICVNMSTVLVVHKVSHCVAVNIRVCLYSAVYPAFSRYDFQIGKQSTSQYVWLWT